MTSHVNNIKICFLKMLGSMNVEQMQIYTPMLMMPRRYSVLSLQKLHAQSVLRIMYCNSLLRFVSVSSDTQAACKTEGTSMLGQLEPEHEIARCPI